MSCIAFFSSHANDPAKCKLLQERAEALNVEWESESASEHSPGVVESAENVSRYWINPVHYDPKTKSLKPTAFDDASSRGMSVNRDAHIERVDFVSQGDERVRAWNEANPSKPQRELIGYSTIGVAAVRDIRPGEAGGSRAFCVYDTANADDKSHADVCQIISTAQGGRSARTQLRDLAMSSFTLLGQGSNNATVE